MLMLLTRHEHGTRLELCLTMPPCHARRVNLCWNDWVFKVSLNESHAAMSIQSAELRDALLDAGWHPGVSRRDIFKKTKSSLFRKLLSSFATPRNCDPYDDPHYVDGMFHVFPAARIILDELWGIRVNPLAPKGPLLPQSIIFNLSLVSGLEHEINMISKFLNTTLVPIGQILSTDVLLMSEECHVFALSFVSTGLFYEGQGLDNGLLRVLQGRASRPVLFSAKLDPKSRLGIEFIPTSCGPKIYVDKVYSLDELDLDMPE